MLRLMKFLVSKPDKDHTRLIFQPFPSLMPMFIVRGFHSGFALEEASGNLLSRSRLSERGEVQNTRY